jgi:hypothetical protein
MKNPTQALEQASIQQYCKAVRVPTIGANFVSLAEQAVKENHSHVQYLEALLAMECGTRPACHQNRIRKPRLKTLRTLISRKLRILRRGFAN